MMPQAAPGRVRRWHMSVVLAVGIVAAGSAPTRAGEYPVRSCISDRGRFNTAAFDEFATRGMRVKRACNPQGPGLRGLVTANVVRRARVGRGARAIVELRAPYGTRFRSFRWSGAARRRDCRYALQLYADGPGIAPVPIRNVRAGRRCPRPGRVQSAGWPRPHGYDVAGATRIVQRVVCVGSRVRRSCSAKGLNYIRTFAASVTVVDVLAPSVRISGGGLAGGRWVKGAQDLTFDAQDNVGVRLERISVGGLVASQPRACDDSRTVPCPNGFGRLSVNTDEAAEGTQPVTVEVTDAAGNTGTDTRNALIDHTPPGRVDVGVEGGEAWRNQNGFTLGWANPPEPDRAPIAGAFYRLCRAASKDCVEPAKRDGAGLAAAVVNAPAPGEWSATLWRQDAAANSDERLASVPVMLRYDPEPPQLGFEYSPVLDPTRVSVLVTDRVSGLAGGQIELSRQGSGSWQTLATRQQGSRLVAQIDDARLPAGDYELRARAVDQARNEASTTSRLDGTPMVVALPLRLEAKLRVGVAKQRLVRRTVRRRGKRRSVRRRVLRLLPGTRVRLGRRVRIAGRLQTRSGEPLAGVELSVVSRSRTAPEKLVGVVRTDRHGRFSYIARGSQSRTLRFAYDGTGVILPASGEVALLVPASSTLQVSRTRVQNGAAVVFSGRLRGLPPPAGGKLVELQVRLNRRWQTFRTTRSDPRGRFAIRYRFVATRSQLARYRFRARLPREAGYPFESGASRSIVVSVRGRG